MDKATQDLIHQYALNAYGFLLGFVALWFPEITPERLALAAGFGLGGYGVATVVNNLRTSP